MSEVKDSDRTSSYDGSLSTCTEFGVRIMELEAALESSKSDEAKAKLRAADEFSACVKVHEMLMDFSNLRFTRESIKNSELEEILTQREAALSCFSKSADAKDIVLVRDYSNFKNQLAIITARKEAETISPPVGIFEPFVSTVISITVCNDALTSLPLSDASATHLLKCTSVDASNSTTTVKECCPNTIFSLGDRCTLFGLTANESVKHNGREGIVVGAVDTGTGRYVVKLSDGHIIRPKPANLRAVGIERHGQVSGHNGDAKPTDGARVLELEHLLAASKLEVSRVDERTKYDIAALKRLKDAMSKKVSDASHKGAVLARLLQEVETYISAAEKRKALVEKTSTPLIEAPSIKNEESMSMFVTRYFEGSGLDNTALTPFMNSAAFVASHLVGQHRLDDAFFGPALDNELHEETIAFSTHDALGPRGMDFLRSDRYDPFDGCYRGNVDALNRPHGLGRWDRGNGYYIIADFAAGEYHGHRISYRRDGSILEESDWNHGEKIEDV